MVSHHHHKVFIGITAIVILVVGLFLGAFLAAKLGTIDLEIINISLTFTSIILILITGGLVLEVKEIVELQRKVKK